jgi:hypothetical protein
MAACEPMFVHTGDHIAAVRTISTNESPVSPTETQARIGGFARSAHSSHARFISSFCAMSVIKTRAVRIRPNSVIARCFDIHNSPRPPLLAGRLRVNHT